MNGTVPKSTVSYQWQLIGQNEPRPRRHTTKAGNGVAFNCIIDRVDNGNKETIYPDIQGKACFRRGELSRITVIRHDYPLHDFAVYVYRQNIASFRRPI